MKARRAKTARWRLIERGADDDSLGLVQVADEGVGEVQVSLDEVWRSQCQPLAQADVLVTVYTSQVLVP